MSDTHKTDPWAVRLRQRPYWIVEHHDHRAGECDLPDRDDLEFFGWRRNGCYWDTATVAWWEAGSCCCCWMCHSYGRREAGRKNRHEARNLNRQLMKYANAREEADAG